MASHTGDVTLDTGRATAAPVRLRRHSGTAIPRRRLSGGLSKPDDYYKYNQMVLVLSNLSINQLVL